MKNHQCKDSEIKSNNLFYCAECGRIMQDTNENASIEDALELWQTGLDMPSDNSWLNYNGL